MYEKLLENAQSTKAYDCTNTIHVLGMDSEHQLEWTTMIQQNQSQNAKCKLNGNSDFTKPNVTMMDNVTE